MGYEDAISYLYGLQKHGIKLGLKRSRRLLSLFGDPQDSFRAIHVAGTNGKGSTSAIAASILRARGFKVGLFTSPHMASFTERIKVNGIEITEEEVIALTEEIREELRGLRPHTPAGGHWPPDPHPTFFEVVTLMGFLYFKRKGVDWAVVETGMGGRLDATNVLNPQAVIITRIGHDHKEFLGGTLGEIAFEKAGVIKQGTPVITCPQLPEAMEVIEAKAKEMSAPLYVMGRDFDSIFRGYSGKGISFDYSCRRPMGGGRNIPGLMLPLCGRHQAENAGLAIKGVTTACGGATSPHDIEAGSPSDIGVAAVRRGIGDVRWPGRFEFIPPRIILDGAHNPQASAALAETLRESPISKGQKIILIMGVMADKDIPGILGPLLPLAHEVVFSDLPYERAASASMLKEQASAMGYKAKTAPSVADALKEALASDGLIVVSGSFYTLGEAKAAMGEPGILKELREVL